MTDDLVPKRLYNVHLLHDDLQKQDNAQFVASNIKISPSGVLEADRVWTDVEFTTKVFYSGIYYVTELGPAEIEDFYSDEHDHEHGDEEIVSIAEANGFELGDICRNCKHVNAFHVDGHDNEQNIPCEKIISQRKVKYCMCLNFDPRSNLQYLEDKYKESK